VSIALIFAFILRVGKIFDLCHIVIVRYFKYCLARLNENELLTSTVKVFYGLRNFEIQRRKGVSSKIFLILLDVMV